MPSHIVPLGQSAKGEAQGAQDETRALLFPASPQGVPPFQVTLILPSWLLGRETKVVPAASFGPSSPSLLHLPQCSCHLPQQILLQGFYTQLPCGRAHRLFSLLDNTARKRQSFSSPLYVRASIRKLEFSQWSWERSCLLLSGIKRQNIPW